MTISCWILLSMRNLSNESCRENQNTYRNHSHKHTHTEILNTRWFKYDRDYLCLNKSQFVPVIFEPLYTYAFSRQQRLRERASMLRYTYIACLFVLIGSFSAVAVKTAVSWDVTELHTSDSRGAV